LTSQHEKDIPLATAWKQELQRMVSSQVCILAASWRVLLILRLVLSAAGIATNLRLLQAANAQTPKKYVPTML
jgi:hypothetical protein